MAQAARGERECPNPGCPHRMYQHHELQRMTYALSEDKTGIVEVPNPAYEPLHFHCDAGDCDCVQVASGERNVPLRFESKEA
jgi:hypothetical protein